MKYVCLRFFPTVQVNWTLGVFITRAELFKAGLGQPRVSARFEFRFESLKSSSVLILLVYRLMIGSSKNNGEIIRENAFEHKKKKPGLNLTPG